MEAQGLDFGASAHRRAETLDLHRPVYRAFVELLEIRGDLRDALGELEHTLTFSRGRGAEYEVHAGTGLQHDEVRFRGLECDVRDQGVASPPAKRAHGDQPDGDDPPGR